MRPAALLAASLWLAGCAGAVRTELLTADERVKLGSAYESQGLRSRAAREYGEALRLDRRSVPALMALGNLAFQRADLIEAEIYYRRALNVSPGHAGANNNLAAVLLARGSRLDLAERLARAALKTAGPYRPFVLSTLANVLIRQGRYREARAALDEAESQTPAGSALLREHLAQSRRQLEAVSHIP